MPTKQAEPQKREYTDSITVNASFMRRWTSSKTGEPYFTVTAPRDWRTDDGTSLAYAKFTVPANSVRQSESNPENYYFNFPAKNSATGADWTVNLEQDREIDMGQVPFLESWQAKFKVERDGAGKAEWFSGQRDGAEALTKAQEAAGEAGKITAYETVKFDIKATDLVKAYKNAVEDYKAAHPKEKAEEKTKTATTVKSKAKTQATPKKTASAKAKTA